VCYQSLRDVLGFRGITQGRRVQSRLVKCIFWRFAQPGGGVQ